MRFFIILSNFLYFSLSFTLNTPVNIYKKVYNDQIIKVYEPNNIDKKNMDAIIFYTGANSLIPADIYSNFIKSLNNYNFSVNVVTNDNSATKELLYESRNEYKNIIPLSHSSGYVSAMNTINSQKNVKKAVFLDPVDNSDLLNLNPLKFMNNNDEDFNYLENILVLNAEKSYKWSLFPKIEIPFIPGFALDTKKLQNNNPNIVLEKISADNYGHSDILDSLWSDLMHATISKGHDDRSNENLVEYYNWLSEQIYNFVNDNNKEEEDIVTTEIVYPTPSDYE
tara:strand:+ start:916 stop:1758 length:843 start_codon:yes stop_codon:yes gene_type:complete